MPGWMPQLPADDRQFFIQEYAVMGGLHSDYVTLPTFLRFWGSGCRLEVSLHHDEIFYPFVVG